ncbi:hypothetical protein F7725_001342 [Dissostichus mawsoni]|uniref:Uncharacterized protein n=1 Tax=Dissostichus mawsoni TaxID=36200 RepID=A0A7J5ZK71_DISMA|nr:hypothetical protein F7725_001342 [Dissostichus mawsoni]
MRTAARDTRASSRPTPRSPSTWSSSAWKPELCSLSIPLKISGLTPSREHGGMDGSCSDPIGPGSLHLFTLLSSRNRVFCHLL